MTDEGEGVVRPDLGVFVGAFKFRTGRRSVSIEDESCGSEIIIPRFYAEEFMRALENAIKGME